MSEIDAQIQDGYARLLEEIARHRLRKFINAYGAYLKKPHDVSRLGYLDRAMKKLESPPTGYDKGQIDALKHRIERGMGLSPKRHESWFTA